MIRIIHIIIFFNLIFCAYNINPENISISGSSAIVYDDFRSINPASLATHKGLSIKLIGYNFGFENNFLSISKYNDINGANFEDKTDPDYYPKSELYTLFENGLKFSTHMAFSIPFSEIVFNNISFHNRAYFINESNLPQSFVKLLLYGNEPNEIYSLNGSSNANIFTESALGYSKKINNFSYGIKIKYLQGLAFGELINLSDNSSFFVTDTTTGFMGEAKYLINQAVGGSGFAFDLGLIYKYSEKMKFGIALNNLLGKINWDDNNLTYNLMRDNIVSNLPLRHNEKQFFSIKLDTLNAMNIINLPLNQIYNIENFSVIEFESIENIPFDIDSLLASNSLIETEFGSYLLKSKNLSTSQIKSFNLKSQYYKTEYPANIIFSLMRELESKIHLSICLESSFSNNLRNSEKWKFSSGIIFNRFQNQPITIGFSIEEKGKIFSGFSYGYKVGPLQINNGIRFNDAIFFQSTKGIDYSFSILFKTNKI
tara:strand:- start:46818 stop:48269 length:1452 start_codon:yes stop_codon:yes gene_type:complete